MILYSVATNNIQVLPEKERKAAFNELPKQPGYVGYCFLCQDMMLWLYKTRGNAESARREASAKKVRCGSKISEFVWDGQSDRMRENKEGEHELLSDNA